MGTNVNLTPELERFAQACVESGRFNNVSEVVRSGLRLLQEAEERRLAFVASLEAARAEALRQGFATVDEVEAEVKATIDAVRTHGASDVADLRPAGAARVARSRGVDRRG
jgi:antitoxin ParD1/3/4